MQRLKALLAGFLTSISCAGATEPECGNGDTQCPYLTCSCEHADAVRLCDDEASVLVEGSPSVRILCVGPGNCGEAVEKAFAEYGCQ